MQDTAAAMPRDSSGTIEVHPWKDGTTLTFRARVRAYGRQWRVTFGTNHEGWSEERARVELDLILDRVRRGTWEPPSSVREGQEEALDVHETVRVTAYRWWQRRKTDLAANTRLDYQWRLDHLLRHLGDAETATLDARKVDDLRQRLVGCGLSPRSVNMMLDLLAQILDDAVEYRLLDANPARGKRRRMKVAKPRRSFLEPDMVIDLLDEAGAWERELPEHQHYGRRAVIAVLCLAGPRISELTDAPRARRLGGSSACRHLLQLHCSRARHLRRAVDARGEAPQRQLRGGDLRIQPEAPRAAVPRPCAREDVRGPNRRRPNALPSGPYARAQGRIHRRLRRKP